MTALKKELASDSDQIEESVAGREQRNVWIWDRLKRTDPSATKPFQRPGFSGTQIDPYFRYRIMTEVFGPNGKGWGYELSDPIFSGPLVFISAKGWYIDPDTKEKVWTSAQYGGDSIMKSRKGGVDVPDDEALKKATTDAVGKALSLIGVGADVYLGQYDDSKYVDETKVFYTVKNNPDLQPPAIEKFEADLKEKLDAATDLDALDDLWKDGVNARIREIGSVDKAAQNRMISAFSQKKNELVKRDQEAEAGRQQPAKEAAPPPAKQAKAAAAKEQATKQPAVEKFQKVQNGSGRNGADRPPPPADPLSPDGIAYLEESVRIKLAQTKDATEATDIWMKDQEVRSVKDRIKEIDLDAYTRMFNAVIARRDELIDAS